MFLHYVWLCYIMWLLKKHDSENHASLPTYVYVSVSVQMAN